MNVLPLADIPSPTLLAELPAEGGYFSPLKIALFFVCLLVWAHSSAWVQKDTKKVRVPQGMWVSLVFVSGVLSLVLWLLVPLYWVSFALYLLVFGTVTIIYVVFRNSRVAPSQTVLTPAHLQRLFKGGGKAKGDTTGKERVRVKDAAGRTPPWPTDPEERAGYQAVQDLLFDIIWRRASDVRMDLVPHQPLRLIYRIDGVDRAREPVDGEVATKIFMHMKKLAGLNPDEHRRPQTGAFRASIGAGGTAEKAAQIDVKSSGSTAGERILLKVYAEESKFRINELGFTKDQLATVQHAVTGEPKGVVLVSAPRQHGLTSTLYAILRSHDAFTQNIHTLELSKALDLENITQHVYDSQDGSVSFAKRFRSILRTEPDICMASDIPDAETAQLAAAAGRANKKVYLGLTAKDTFSALRAFLHGVGDNGLAAASLLLVTNQRLVRVLCPSCRRAYKPDPNLLKKANLPLGENRPFFRPPNPDEIGETRHGNPIVCQACQGSGYLGRTGVFELLVVDDVIRSFIAKGAPLATIKSEARKKGMLYLQEVALQKVYEGLTSIGEVLRVTRETAPAAAAAS